MKGREFNPDYLNEVGRFSTPVLVDDDVAGLEMRMPASPFGVEDISRLVGSEEVVDVLNVNDQHEGNQMTLDEWKAYFCQSPVPNDFGVQCVVDLDYSGSPLDDIIEQPSIIHTLDWISNHWPADADVQPQKFHKYCSMAVAGTYIDFRLGKLAASGWLHVYSGQVIIYMIEPTECNLRAFEKWSRSTRKHEVFFGDLVAECYKVVVKEASTFFIPSGWIFAQHAPEDTVLFGGNFLTEYCTEIQIRVHEVLKGSRPDSELVQIRLAHVFAAKSLLGRLDADANSLPPHLHRSLARLVEVIEEWSHDNLLPKWLHRHTNVEEITTSLRQILPNNCVNDLDSTRLKITVGAPAAGAAKSGAAAGKPRKKAGGALKLTISANPSLKIKLGGSPRAKDTKGAAARVAGKQPSKKRKASTAMPRAAGKSAMDDMLVGKAAVEALFRNDADLDEDEDDSEEAVDKDDSDGYVLSDDGDGAAADNAAFFAKAKLGISRKIPRRSADDDDEAWIPASSRQAGVKLVAGSASKAMMKVIEKTRPGAASAQKSKAKAKAKPKKSGLTSKQRLLKKMKIGGSKSFR